MNLLRRAFLYDTRKKGKTILLFLMLFLIFTLILIALAVRNGAEHSAAQLRASLGGSFKLSIFADREDSRMWKTQTIEAEDGIHTSFVYTGPAIDEEFLQKVMAVDGVKEYSVVEGYELYCENIKTKPGLVASFIGTNNEHPLDKYWMKVLQFFVVGKGGLHEYFRTGAFEIVEGRQIQADDDHKAVISEELAKLNGFKIGDTFSAECNDLVQNLDYKTTHGDPINFEIVGFYKVNSRLDDSQYSSERSFPENFIFIDKTSGKEIRNNWNEFYKGYEGYSQTDFFVEDPAKLDEVISRVQQIDVNWYYYRISKDDAAYRSSVEPLSTMSTLSTILILILLIACLFLLYLIVKLGVQSRKREMGIYHSIGIGKTKILGQLLVELLLVSVIAFCGAWGVSKATAGPIGNAALKIAQPEQGELDLPKLELAPYHIVLDVPAQEPENFRVIVSDKETLIVAGMGLAVLVGSVYLAGIPILKRKPREVLSLME